jgi:hypothetical protein
MSNDPRFGGSLHHYHVFAIALEELQKQISTGRREDVLRELERELRRRTGDRSDSTRQN